MIADSVDSNVTLVDLLFLACLLLLTASAGYAAARYVRWLHLSLLLWVLALLAIGLAVGDLSYAVGLGLVTIPPVLTGYFWGKSRIKRAHQRPH
jgi:hypothetical protein